jgi:hypothetical protein
MSDILYGTFELDADKVRIFNAALRLAVAERTGVDDENVTVLDSKTYILADADRAIEIRELWPTDFFLTD